MNQQHDNDVDDDEFDDLAYLQSKMKASLVWQRNEPLCCQVLFEVLPKWKLKFSKACWKKIRKRIIKELNEVEPCIAFVQSLLIEQERPVMIVDLCSGFGILPMILSEVLHTEKVSQIYLMDNSFPLDASKVQSHHISVEHLVPTNDWRIPLKFRKVDLKVPRQKRQLHQYIFPQNESIIFTGIHLCKALSVHAINLYHEHRQRTDRIVALCLKPCCLPGKRNLFADKQPICYQFPSYNFCPLVLYPFMDNRTKRPEHVVAADERNHNDTTTRGTSDEPEEDEPDLDDTASCNTEPDGEGSISCCPHHRFGRGNKTNRRFTQWVEHLRRGCESDGCEVKLLNVVIQDHHFQNQYICCQPTTMTI